MANDELAIRQLVKRLEAAWNAGDSVGIAAPFVDDAGFVNIMGEYYKGRAPIEAGHWQIFDTIHKGARSASRWRECDLSIPIWPSRFSGRI